MHDQEYLVVPSGGKWFLSGSLSDLGGVQMFIGEYQHSFDAKGRLIMPAKFRAQLGERCIATRGMDRCLFVFPLDEWDVLDQKLRKLPLTKTVARNFSRFIYSGATEWSWTCRAGS